MLIDLLTEETRHSVLGNTVSVN